MQRFAQTRRKRSVAFVITDLLDTSPSLSNQLRQLVACRHEVVLLHLLDPFEIDFPFDNPTHFSSMEDHRKLFVHPRSLRKAYREEMQLFLQTTRDTMTRGGIDYHLIRTDTHPKQALADVLRARSVKAH